MEERLEVLIKGNEEIIKMGNAIGRLASSINNDVKETKRIIEFQHKVITTSMVTTTLAIIVFLLRVKGVV